MTLPQITVVMRPTHIDLVFSDPGVVQHLSIAAACDLLEALAVAIRAITVTDERTRVH